jgi:large subunit ribosomal protein L18
MKLKTKQKLLQKRCWRIRKKIKGTSDRPRLSLKFTNKHIYAQCIDDTKGHTLIHLSSLTKSLKESNSACANKESSILLAKEFTKQALVIGIKSVVFDRNGRQYHGCVQSFADAARTAGLSF